MRILKNPNQVEEIVKTCPECECMFAFTDGDIKTYSYSNNILGPGFYGYSKRYVLCPNCGKEIIIEGEEYKWKRLNNQSFLDND